MVDPSGGSIRDKRLAMRIAEELPAILEGARDDRLRSLEIVRVEAGQRGQHVLVVFGPPGDRNPETGGVEGPREMLEILKRAAGWIRSEIVDALDLGTPPEVTFLPDPARWSEWNG